MEVKRATHKDLNDIMKIIENARAYFKKYGIEQWQNGKPDEEEISREISNDEVYVLYDEDEMIGFASVTIVTESESGSFAVIRRIAVDKGFKNKGFATEFMDYAYERCKKLGIGRITVDTHPENLAMRRTLKKSGFMQMGTVTVDGDSSFLAYEKEIRVLNKT